MDDAATAIRRWRRGQESAAVRQRLLLREEGARPDQAIAEALDALDALHDMGTWPGPRDPVSERAIGRVRRRWTRIEQRARRQR